VKSGLDYFTSGDIPVHDVGLIIVGLITLMVGTVFQLLCNGRLSTKGVEEFLRQVSNTEVPEKGVEDARLMEADGGFLRQISDSECEIAQQFMRQVSGGSSGGTGSTGGGLGGLRFCFAAGLLGCLTYMPWSFMFIMSQPLARHFGKEDQMSLFVNFGTFGSMSVALLNARYGLLFSLRARTQVVVTVLSCCYMLTSMACRLQSTQSTLGFVLALFSVSCQACMIGGVAEQNALHLLKHYPLSVLPAWGAGAGSAGLLCTCIYLGFQGLGLSLQQI
jgi:hypothetical protein